MRCYIPFLLIHYVTRWLPRLPGEALVLLSYLTSTILLFLSLSCDTVRPSRHHGPQATYSSNVPAATRRGNLSIVKGYVCVRPCNRAGLPRNTLRVQLLLREP